MMSFNRLWYDIKSDGDHICNNFGQAQFMRYPTEDKHINLINKHFELMYPVSPEDNQYNCKSGHLVYNAPYSVKDDPEDLAKGFAEFIALCEDIPPRAIVKFIFGSDDGHHLLELNWGTHQLVVYRRAGDKRLRDFYNLRNDFDNSPYGMFEREKAFPCIFGSEKNPTPRGLFRVESKTLEEYFSGYYPEHDQVKFFGYLEIVEDYFIHSDLYAADVTKDAMRSGKAKLLSKADKYTSGCVRVSQDALDWLVENIEVGAIVIL